MNDDIPSLKPRELIKILERMGFRLYRKKGSHRIFVREELMVIVPYHNRDLKKGTLHNIIKGMGLTPDEFKRLL